MASDQSHEKTGQTKLVEVGAAYLADKVRRGQKIFQYDPNHPIKSSGRPLTDEEISVAQVGIWQHSIKVRGEDSGR